MKSHTLEIVSKYIKRTELQKNVIRVLSICANLEEIRVLASNLLESFFTNAQTGRFAKELATKVSANCKESNENDYLVLQNFLKLKVKGIHGQAAQEATLSMLKNNLEYPKIALSYLIKTEFSSKQ